MIRAIYGDAGLPYRHPERLIDVWEPNGDYYPVAKFPESRPCHGVDEIVRFVTEFHEAWDSVDATTESLIAIGDDRVLVRVDLRAEGRESGLNLGGEVFFCLWLRHGKIFRQEDHLTLRGALHALGLSGETLEEAGLSE